MNVLLIDADPQGSLSQGFFGSAVVENLKTGETLAAIFDDEGFPSLKFLPAPTAFERITVIRANASLAQFNVPQPEHSGLKQFALFSSLEDVTGFDIILIDCPPNLYQCSWNALLASRFVVIPVPPEDFATQGLRAIHQAIEQARLLNGSLQLLGHLVIRADRRLLVHRSYEQHLRKLYGPEIFDTVIPEASAFKVALSCRKPVTLYNPLSNAARLIGILADEMLARITRKNFQRAHPRGGRSRQLGLCRNSLQRQHMQPSQVSGPHRRYVGARERKMGDG